MGSKDYSESSRLAKKGERRVCSSIEKMQVMELVRRKDSTGERGRMQEELLVMPFFLGGDTVGRMGQFF